ncbi:unnamed protein product [Peniophora sp. CBMAI 1063]|nr:unnamed protein product [Peniophora sp. CBMAI 1063]
MSGKDRVLNVDQAEAIASILHNEFLPIIRQNDPEFSGFAAVSKWVAERRSAILSDDPLFASTGVPDQDKKLKSVVDRRFRNYYHGVRVRESPLGKAILKHLVPHPTGLQLFEQDVKQESADDDDDAKAQSSRLKKQYKALDKPVHDTYEKEAEKIAKDVDQNRRKLINNFKTLLDVLCRDELFGGMAAITFFSFRDLDTNEIQPALCDGRVADDGPKFGERDDEASALTTLANAWREYSELAIPYQSPRSVSPDHDHLSIPRNSQGIPVFPDVDLMNINPNKLEEVVINYYQAVWGHSGDLRLPHDLPWDDLVRNAPDFYDIDGYSYLCFDKDRLRQPGTLFPLAEELQQHCGIDSHAPFTFRLAPRPKTVSSGIHPPLSSDATCLDRQDAQQYQAEPGQTVTRASRSPSPNQDAVQELSLQVSSAAVPGSTLDVDWEVPGEDAQPALDLMQPLAQARDDGTQQPLKSVHRSQKRQATVESRSSATELKADKSLRRNGTRGRDVEARETGRKRPRVKHDTATNSGTTLQDDSVSKDDVITQNGSNVAPVSWPFPVPGEKEIFISKGYKFKMTKSVQNSWHVGRHEYVDLGGVIMGPEEFNDRQEVPAMVVIARDPEWMADRMASRKSWQKHILARPEE